MKISKRIGSLFLILVTILLLLPVRTLAAGKIDPEQEVSLTIRNSYAGEGLDGVTFELYLISTMDAYGELTPTAAFQKYEKELDIRGENEEAWKLMAERLEREIILGIPENAAPADTAVTDGSGTAFFLSGKNRLTQGLYLVMGTRTEKSGYVYATAPFFVMLPGRDPDSDEWDYSVEAGAKPEKSPVLADFEVIKIWKDDCHKTQRPKTVTIQLMRNGAAYGDPVTLPENGAWKHTWKNLDVNDHWTVTETRVEGYQSPEIRQEGNTFVVTNICSKPLDSGGSSGDKPKPSLPQTGQPWWPVPVLLACGILLIILGLLRRRGAQHEE